MLRIELPKPFSSSDILPPRVDGGSASEVRLEPPAQFDLAAEVLEKPSPQTEAGEQRVVQADPVVHEAPSTLTTSTSGDYTTSNDGCLPPPVSAFIRAFQAPTASSHDAWLQDVKGKLKQALRGYSLDVNIIGDRLTPNAALIRLRGTDRMTVAEVEKRREVLLTSHALDVIGVRPEKGEVVVMVARDKRAILDLREAWAQRELPDTAPQQNASFVIGERENDGRLLYLNLAGAFGEQPMHGPHTLIAGETGGGKGVLTRNLILDICATNSPANARIQMIDPKSGGDYPWLSQMPHLDGGLITTQADAIEAMKDLVAVMESRYTQITKVAANIDRYNAKVEPAQRIPRIYLFHDELGDWMADKDNADYREAVESYVVRLASKARAAGIHLFLITQRPDKDALPGQVKANMNNKICLRVASQTNSRIVLDENGAESLLGHGHFAAKLANERPSNQSSLIFGQVPFMDDDDAHELAACIADHWRG